MSDDASAGTIPEALTGKRETTIPQGVAIGLLRLLHHDLRWFVVDFETTGIYAPIRPVESALVDRWGSTVAGGFCNPGRAVEPEAQAIHGIEEAAWEGWPLWDQHLRDLADTAAALRPSVIFAWSAAYDSHVWGAEGPPLLCAWDLYWSAVGAPEPGKRRTLAAACEREGVQHKRQHRAADDAAATAALLRVTALRLRQADD